MSLAARKGVSSGGGDTTSPEKILPREPAFGVQSTFSDGPLITEVITFPFEATTNPKPKLYCVSVFAEVGQCIALLKYSWKFERIP